MESADQGTSDPIRPPPGSVNGSERPRTTASPPPSADEPPTLLEVSVADVLTRPEADHVFLWGGIIPIEALTLLAAHGGVGKSTFALQLLICTAVGKDFLGLPTRKSRGLFFSAEDAGSVIRSRLRGLCLAEQIDPADLDERLYVLDATEAGILVAEQWPQRRLTPTTTFERLAQFIEDKDIEFLVVDNSSDAFAGNPFDRSQVTQFIRALVGLVSRRGGAVLLLSHVAKVTARAGSKPPDEEGYADSAAWNNAARSRLFMRNDGEEIVLTHPKNNYGPKAEPMRLRRSPEGALRLADSGALDFKSAIASAEAAACNLKAQKQSLLGLLVEFYDRREWVSTSPTAPGRTPHALFRHELPFPNLSKGATNAVFRLMEREGLIAKETYQKPNRHSGERWAPTEAGRALVLAAPNELRQARQVAPTSPPVEPDAVSAGHGEAAPTPCASTLGGMGGERGDAVDARPGSPNLREVILPSTTFKRVAEVDASAERGSEVVAPPGLRSEAEPALRVSEPSEHGHSDQKT